MSLIGLLFTAVVKLIYFGALVRRVLLGSTVKYVSFALVSVWFFWHLNWQPPAYAEPTEGEPKLAAEIPVMAPTTSAGVNNVQSAYGNVLPPHAASPSDASRWKAKKARADELGFKDPDEICLAIHPPAQQEAVLVGDSTATAAYSDASAITISQASTADQSNTTNPPATDTSVLGTPPPKPVPCWQTPTPFAPEGELRRAIPAPLDPVFPSQEWVGQPLIGVPDTDRVWPLESAIYKACPALKKARIKIYGWANPGYSWSTSKHSTIPLSYAIVPRRLEMEQLILRIERTPDTVQKEHMDWGFRVSNLYGIDYRWTTALGWYPASKQLLRHNDLYGYDPVELYGQIYIPKVAQGMIIRVGRYISPPDIEAQLAPDNYLWTHSIMFTFDAYTHTGIQTTVKLSDQWMIQGGIHSVSDMAPWAAGAEPTLEAYLRWTSRSNNDSIFGGIDGINNGRFRLAREVVQAEQVAALTGTNPVQVPAHDNLQQFNVTWGHRFSRRVHMMTEAYLLYSIDALQGGTPNYGPPHQYNQLTGPGAYLPGVSVATGFVNYTNFKITDKDYISVRPVDYLIDPRGWRTGFRTTYASWTVGWVHHFSDLLTIRPEIRYERALTHVDPYDNGTRRYQFTLGTDLIQRF